MDKINYSIMITGKVQGVWFRRYTKEKANELEIKGFVQNEFDRTVFISAEGTKESLDKFIDWLYEGSPLSRVKEVIYDDCIDFQEYTRFEIREND